MARKIQWNVSYWIPSAYTAVCSVKRDTALSSFDLVFLINKVHSILFLFCFLETSLYFNYMYLALFKRNRIGRENIVSTLSVLRFQNSQLHSMKVAGINAKYYQRKKMEVKN